MLVPGVGFRNETILPQSAIKWLLAQPESSLSPSQATAEISQLGYSLGEDKYANDIWPGLLARLKTNTVLGRFCGDMNEELQRAFDLRFGTDENNWKEIDLFRTVQMVVAQAASRFTVGLPLCQFNTDDYLIGNNGTYTDVVSRS